MKHDYIRLNTTISRKGYELLEKYRKEFGTQKAVIERALEVFDSMKNPQLNASKDVLWVQLKESVDQVAISKRMLTHLMGGDVEKALVDNASQYLISWYLGKPIEEATIDEIVDAIKVVYEATNVFRRIDVTHSDDNSHIQMVFWHTMDKRVSDFCARYFKYFFENVLKCKVVYYTQNISFVLHIEKPKNKK